MPASARGGKRRSGGEILSATLGSFQGTSKDSSGEGARASKVETPANALVGRSFLVGERALKGGGDEQGGEWRFGGAILSGEKKSALAGRSILSQRGRRALWWRSGGEVLSGGGEGRSDSVRSNN